MTRKTVLFDFDGVIADAFHIAHSVAQKMCVYLTESEHRKWFEGNIHEADAALRAVDHGDRCDHALDWFAEFAPRFKTHAKPFAGMPQLLEELSNIYSLCVVSSTRGDIIRHFLEKFDLQNAVEGIYGAEVNTRKDEKFKAIFEKYEIEPRETIFVTDTLGDVNEAASVGLRSIGVTWGFQDHATLERGKPFRIIDSPQELPAAIAAHFAAIARYSAGSFA